ncbi:helix-turn-helix transcriptional regulator [Alcaligenes faecalis]|uniref:Helix-turn-helix transcriptional regulator n=1 Tax=Alcaligenes faecalis TaxID=511 RepID=A0ABY7N5L6_ALCFA|nr:helix-turn-helix transcriptional regulator [Alcaligenes faecalis]WBM39356.1 helix-turn-helix transcriptional regulator [Alcaligenes faecalis]
MRTLERTRPDLAAFLRACRERLLPEEVGLPSGGRRRTPGLRREEVAALAGVGLTWYTWLEQGRDIGVSASFLDNLARVLKLDAAERRHLFLLAHERLPAEPGITWCVLPPLVRRLMHDLPHPAFVLNLRWDVLGFNALADDLLDLGAYPEGQRNLLWQMFTNPALHTRFVPWESQALEMLSSFRRDFARATDGTDIHELANELKRVSPEFKLWWEQHDVHPPCGALRTLLVDGELREFEQTSLIIDESRHLRMVVYVPPLQQGHGDGGSSR